MRRYLILSVVLLGCVWFVGSTPKTELASATPPTLDMATLGVTLPDLPGAIPIRPSPLPDAVDAALGPWKSRRWTSRGLALYQWEITPTRSLVLLCPHDGDDLGNVGTWVTPVAVFMRWHRSSTIDWMAPVAPFCWATEINHLMPGGATVWVIGDGESLDRIIQSGGTDTGLLDQLSTCRFMVQ